MSSGDKKQLEKKINKLSENMNNKLYTDFSYYVSDSFNRDINGINNLIKERNEIKNRKKVMNKKMTATNYEPGKYCSDK